MNETAFMMGSEAIAQAAIYAGCRAYFGYPITPSSEIMEMMARELPKVGGVFLQMEDEIASMAGLVGASWAGAKAMTATSGPGFSLMQENLGLATMLELPCVVVNVQRVGPSTGIPTLGAQQDLMQAIWGRHGDQVIPVLSPSTLQEMYDLTVRAFNLAERYRVPAVLLTDGEMARLRGEVTLRRDLPVEQRRPLEAERFHHPYQAGPDGVPGFPTLGSGAYVVATGLAHDTQGYPTEDVTITEQLLNRLRDKVFDNAGDIIDYEEKDTTDADILLVAYGAAAPSVRRAHSEIRQRGGKAGYFIPKTLVPFPEDALAKAVEGCDRIVVAEMSLGQLVHLVKGVIGRSIPIQLVSCLGKPLDPQLVMKASREKAIGR